MKLFTVAAVGRCAGILLSPDCSHDNALALVRDPKARDFFPYPALITRERTGGQDDSYFVTSDFVNLPTPDEAEEGRTYTLVTESAHREYSPHQRFNRCTQLIKVMGCSNCDLRGRECHLKGGAPEELVDRKKWSEPVDLEQEEVYQKLGSVGSLADLTFIPSSQTRTEDFQSRFRKPTQHSFDELEENKKKLSKRAENAAETRVLKKKNCTHCLFGHKLNSGNYTNGCDSTPRYCKGPFADEAAQQAYELEQGDAAVKEFLANSEFTEGQFWAVAGFAGYEGRVNRYGVVLGGWRKARGGGFDIRIMRNKTRIYDVSHVITNYGELRQVFKDLPPRTHEFKRPDDKLRAIWYAALNKDDVLKRVGWGDKWRSVAVRRIDDSCVSVRMASDSYMYWSMDSYYSLYQVYSSGFGNPPITLTPSQLSDKQQAAQRERLLARAAQQKPKPQSSPEPAVP